MNLWLLCCVLLFITSQGYSWLSQQAWFVMPELALPWILLGGTGLAIASNRHLLHSHSQRHIAPPAASTQCELSQPAFSPASATPSKATNRVGKEAAKASSQPTSISFEIPKKTVRSQSS
jgi:hypothetical protein